MNNNDLEKMTADELWTLREKIQAILSTKLRAKKHELERRLAQIKGLNDTPGDGAKQRRPYPKVHPKYRNPDRPFETWSGRGKKPRWLRAQLRSGKKVNDLLISRAH